LVSSGCGSAEVAEDLAERCRIDKTLGGWQINGKWHWMERIVLPRFGGPVGQHGLRYLALCTFLAAEIRSCQLSCKRQAGMKEFNNNTKYLHAK
jgi:hypothetical protein